MSVLVPTRVKREDILVEHTLKQADHMVAIFHDQPILFILACEFFKT